MTRKPRSTASSRNSASSVQEVVVGGIPYTVDLERREVLRDNLYVDCILARDILRQVAQSGTTRRRRAKRS
jgi:hypothetical protein